MIRWNGFDRDELQRAFDGVCDKDNWKNPIDAIVEVQDLSVVCSAIAFFAGGYPNVSRETCQYYRVKSPGYYAIVGS